MKGTITVDQKCVGPMTQDAVTTAQRHAMNEAKSRCTQLQKAIHEQLWEDIPSLLHARNQALHKALTDTLGDHWFQEANSLLSTARAQDKTLKEKAEAETKHIKEELLKRKHGKKSVQAYQST